MSRAKSGAVSEFVDLSMAMSTRAVVFHAGPGTRMWHGVTMTSWRLSGGRGALHHDAQ